MSLDHGILNVPLAKRGDINRQLDAYKAQQAAEEAAKHKVAVAKRKTDKAAAKVALAELIAAPGLLDMRAANLKTTRKDVIAMLMDWSKWQPVKVIKARNEWLPEAA